VVVPLHNEEHEVLHLNNTVKKVVVGSDETRWGLMALKIAAELANGWGADLEVLSAAAVPSSQSIFFGISFKRDEQDQVVEAFTEDLDKRVAPIAEQYPDLKITKKVIPGSAVDAILKESSEDDVIVVGSRGRGGFTGLILGSTSQGLIQHATSPVYVVPRRFVEASELNAVKATEAQPVASKSIDDISGVQEVKVPEVGQEVASAIDSKIDPEHD
jgi:nucleotide-binding universal stress UspA family protein